MAVYQELIITGFSVGGIFLFIAMFTNPSLMGIFGGVGFIIGFVGRFIYDVSIDDNKKKKTKDKSLKLEDDSQGDSKPKSLKIAESSYDAVQEMEFNTEIRGLSKQTNDLTIHCPNVDEFIFEKYGIDYIYHMTHYKNIKSILQNGLLAHENDLVLKRIDNHDVNNRRGKIESINNKSIHSYVPFYFNPKNPMLFVNKEIQHNIVILAFSKHLLTKKKTIFTDGNAAVNRTKFYADLSFLEELNWDCINAPYWNDFEYGKSERMAEILINKKVTSKHLQKIICFDAEKKRCIQNIDNELNVEVNKKFFFQ
jgi:hypothetical protein